MGESRGAPDPCRANASRARDSLFFVVAAVMLFLLRRCSVQTASKMNKNPGVGLERNNRKVVIARNILSFHDS